MPGMRTMCTCQKLLVFWGPLWKEERFPSYVDLILGPRRPSVRWLGHRITNPEYGAPCCAPMMFKQICVWEVVSLSLSPFLSKHLSWTKTSKLGCWHSMDRTERHFPEQTRRRHSVPPKFDQENMRAPLSDTKFSEQWLPLIDIYLFVLGMWN